MRYDVLIFGCTLNNNYGSIMTYYALYKVIKDNGYNVALTCNPYDSREDHAVKFCKENTDLAIALRRLEYNKYCDMTDTLLLGSDQVWNYNLFKSSFDKMFYFDFDNQNLKKISYAASFGFDYFNGLLGSQNETFEIKQLLNRFDYLAVREDDGQKICKNVFDLDAKWVIDPVFLLDESQYIELANKAKNKPQKAYITSYFLNADEEYNNLLTLVSKELGLPMVNMITGHPNRFDKQRELSIEPVCENLSMEEWLYNIKNSEFVVTNSYHCLCFSIIFKKKFIIIQKKWAPSRIKSLLNLLGLQDRLISSFDEINDKTYLLKDEIDYAAVGTRLTKSSDDSLKWLLNAISGPKKFKYVSVINSENLSNAEKNIAEAKSLKDYIDIINENNDQYVVMAALKGNIEDNIGDVKYLMNMLRYGNIELKSTNGENIIEKDQYTITGTGKNNHRFLGVNIKPKFIEMIKEKHRSFAISFDWSTESKQGAFKFQLAGPPWDDVTDYITISSDVTSGHYENVFTTADSIIKFDRDNLQIRADYLLGDLNIRNLKIEEGLYSTIDYFDDLDEKKINGFGVVFDSNGNGIYTTCSNGNISLENSNKSFVIQYQNKGFRDIQNGFANMYISDSQNEKKCYTCKENGIYMVTYSKRLGEVIDVILINGEKIKHMN